MEKENKKIKVVSLIAMALLTLIVIGASFAYFGSFSQNTKDHANVNVNTGAGLNTSFISTSAPLNLHATLANMIEKSVGEVVADSNSNLNVTLTFGSTQSSYNCKYDIVYEYESDSLMYGCGSTPVTSSVDKELTLKISGPSTGTNSFSEEKNFSFASSCSNKKMTVVKDAVINDNTTSGTTQSWNINLKFYLLSESQAALQGQNFSGNFYVENVRCGVNNEG